MVVDGQSATKLFHAIATGDERALHSLYRAHADWVLAIAVRLLGDPSAAEDVVQDTFLKIWRTADRFDSASGSARAWIAIIARNTALDHMRRRRPTELLVENDPQFRLEPLDPPDPKLQKCLSCLPPDQAIAIVTMYRYGLSHSELAEHIGVPAGTAKSRVLRGTRALRECMTLQKSSCAASESAVRCVMLLECENEDDDVG